MENWSARQDPSIFVKRLNSVFHARIGICCPLSCCLFLTRSMLMHLGVCCLPVNPSTLEFFIMVRVEARVPALCSLVRLANILVSAIETKLRTISHNYQARPTASFFFLKMKPAFLWNNNNTKKTEILLKPPGLKDFIRWASPTASLVDPIYKNQVVRELMIFGSLFDCVNYHLNTSPTP